MKDFIDQLQQQLQQPLPGRDVQYEMAHAVRRSYQEVPATAKKAGVLALFYPKDAAWHIVLIERTAKNPNDRHKGQISFPGGRYEPEDGDLSVTALREAEEEVGVSSTSIELLGKLTDLYIPVSNFAVFPYVGFTPNRPEFTPQQSEVHAILEVPFNVLAAPNSVSRMDLKISQQITLQQVPYFDVAGKVVWGATAMMLNELIAITRQG
ncbi:MAG: CoA pyrophosphatase [Bacteroidota bacterium]